VTSAPRRQPVRFRLPGPLALGALMVLTACGVPPDLQPDDVLREGLELTGRDEVHRVTLSGERGEPPEPAETDVPVGAWVEFVTADWLIHEVTFELDSLDSPARSFLSNTDQVASPPLINRDSRFVVHFEDAPSGRYPFRIEGNGPTVRGAVTVRSRG
jgi:plastocyanin